MSYTALARVGLTKSRLCITPRLSIAKSITWPMKSDGTNTPALTYGSSIVSILLDGGRLAGLSTRYVPPEVSVTLYMTDGAVVIRSSPYSRSSLSCTISMCSSPRKPHRNPNPKATEVSGSNQIEASLSCSFSRASRRSPYAEASIGYMPEYTMGVAGLYPGRGALAGRLADVIVSPTGASPTCFIWPTMKPTSPGPSRCAGCMSGRNTPTSVTSYCLPELIIWMTSPGSTLPSNTRMWAMTPRYGSKWESKISARSGASASPDGGGTTRATASSTSGTPSPVLALVMSTSEGLTPRRSTSSARTRSGSALGRSTLFTTGTISRPLSMARYRLDKVCACTPWVASTTRTAPSQAASERDTSYVKSTWPGVSIRLRT